MTLVTSDLASRYTDVRRHSAALCAPLAIEDYVPQPVVDVSPPKWHLAHTTWFFESMVLEPHDPAYGRFHDRFGFLFNSYYESQGRRVARPERGHLSRPTVAEVLAYREHVDASMARVLEGSVSDDVRGLIELGLQHEQQHQELLLTDIKYILGVNPVPPAYDSEARGGVDVRNEHAPEASDGGWAAFDGGTIHVGHTGQGFAFDNEGPRHAQLVAPVAMRRSLVTNREYLAFMTDGGYERFELWHADGWQWIQGRTHRAPLYWQPDTNRPGEWLHYTLAGLRPVDSDAPVTHVSHYEAFAFCVWAGWRLASEFEWEALADRLPWGRRWEWTASAYQPYPRFQPAPGAVGEYNGKFMINQLVLRGASFATPRGHARKTYRNFFQPALGWQYTGIRPARDI